MERAVLAVVVVLTFVVVLLGFLVFGLLRSHADLVRALHSLGVGPGDPGEVAAPAGARPVSMSTRAGPPLPAERSNGVHDLEGISPQGGSVAVTVSASPLTLVVFLTSGCSSCSAVWSALADPEQLAALPAGLRVVAVTKGAEWESPGAVAAKAPPGITVVMSTAAWGDYEVPGSPYFVLVDGRRGVRLGEGVAQHLGQVAEMLQRADADEEQMRRYQSRSQASGLGLSGAEREAHNDAILLAAGITPGHPSLYPKDLGEVFASTRVQSTGGDR
jgi:hypothetical protein